MNTIATSIQTRPNLGTVPLKNLQERKHKDESQETVHMHYTNENLVRVCAEINAGNVFVFMKNRIVSFFFIWG